MFNNNNPNFKKLRIIIGLFIALFMGYIATESLGYRMLDIFGTSGVQSETANGSYGSQHK